jgi:hypothetical protein
MPQQNARAGAGAMRREAARSRAAKESLVPVEKRKALM